MRKRFAMMILGIVLFELFFMQIGHANTLYLATENNSTPPTSISYKDVHLQENATQDAEAIFLACVSLSHLKPNMSIREYMQILRKEGIDAKLQISLVGNSDGMLQVLVIITYSPYLWIEAYGEPLEVTDEIMEECSIISVDDETTLPEFKIVKASLYAKGPYDSDYELLSSISVDIGSTHVGDDNLQISVYEPSR